jgi:hypothetical protein
MGIFVRFIVANLPETSSGNALGESISSAKMYRDSFSSNYNLSFYVPKEDQCPICSRLMHVLQLMKKEIV